MEKREVRFNKQVEARATGYVVTDTTDQVDGDGHHTGNLVLAQEIEDGMPINMVTIPAKDIIETVA